MKKQKQIPEPIEICFETCVSCVKQFDIEKMTSDSAGNWFCLECWEVLAPVMEAEYEELKEIEFISVKDSYPENHPELVLSDDEKKQLKSKITKTKEVEILYKDGHTEIGRRLQMPGENYCGWINHEKFDEDDPLFITHWRPIKPL